MRNVYNETKVGILAILIGGTVALLILFVGARLVFP